ncbi:MAG TPA: branched-chain amino acid ABC transporter permease, partial [Micromonospora sp.]
MTEVRTPTVVTTSPEPVDPRSGGRDRWLALAGRWWPLAAVLLLAVVPYSTLYLPGIFDDVLNTPGTMQLLAICLVFGALATSYDLLFGRTGLLSFGHALYFAAGAY